MTRMCMYIGIFISAIRIPAYVIINITNITRITTMILVILVILVII